MAVELLGYNELLKCCLTWIDIAAQTHEGETAVQGSQIDVKQQETVSCRPLLLDLVFFWRVVKQSSSTRTFAGHLAFLVFSACGIFVLCSMDVSRVSAFRFLVRKYENG